MTYTLTEKQLISLILEVIELVEEGGTFECWEAKDRDGFEVEDEEGDISYEDEWGNPVEDAWYFYPQHGDPFCINELNSLQEINH